MNPLVGFLFLIGDIFFLNLSIVLSYKLIDQNDYSWVNLIYLIIFSNLTWLFLITVAAPYSFSKKFDGLKTLKDQLTFIGIHLLVVLSLVFFFQKSYSSIQIALIYLFFVPIFFVWKLVALFLTSQLATKKVYNTKNVLIVGDQSGIEKIKKQLSAQSQLKYNFVGQVESANNLPMEEIILHCNEKRIDEIVANVPFKVDLKELIDFGLNKLISIKVMADLSKEIGNPADVSHFNYGDFLEISTIPLDDIRNQILKRFFDLLFSSAFILLIMTWLLPLVALCIKLDSKGPVFFKQKRNGKGNNPFYCMKFRTMVVNDQSDTKQATSNDPRVTRVGKFLRKSSLDELPQFFNVFLGQMSVIGPRPHPVKLNEEFAPKIKKLTSRHYVKPGISGLAQSMGYRGETSSFSDMKNRVTLDRFYIENWSFELDLKIIYMTVVSLIRISEKAY